MTPDELPPFTIAFYEDHLHHAPLSIERLTWPEVVDLLSEHERTDCAPCPGGKCPAKFGLAFSPAAPRAGKTRGDKNVETVGLLVLDFDHLHPDELQRVSDSLEGVEAVCYSTHSHRAEDACIRVVLPLARALPPDEFRRLHAAVRSKYGFDWKRPDGSHAGADPAAKDVSRLYFLPTSPVGAETLTGHEHGALLDIDALLAAGPPLVPVVPRAEVVQQSISGPVDMDGLRLLLRGYNKRDNGQEAISKRELVRRVREGEPLVRVEEKGQREKSCHRLGKILAYALPIDTSVEALVELIRPSVMAIPTFAGDGEDDTIEARFSKVKESWAKGIAENTASKIARASEREKDEIFRDRFAKRFSRPRSTSGAPEASDPIEPNDDDDDGDEVIDIDDWEKNLLKTMDKKGNEVLKALDANAHTILAYHPRWRWVLKYDEVKKNVVTNGGPLAKYEKTPSQVISGVKYWLQRKYDLGLRKNDVMDAITHVAKMNAFDPLKDYLNGLKWDGVERIDTFFEEYCGAATVDGNGDDITEHVRRISRRWFIGAVARGLDPGCKMDNVLILEGDQAAKKTTTIEALGGKWFANSPGNIADKDSKMLAAQNWIIELPELSAMHASETDAQKAFFSSRIDQFRPPYGYSIETFPRRCVFIGSTNDEKYLKDITGNRRYWPVYCAALLVAKILRDRDQLFAQAVALFKASAKCAPCAARADGEERCPMHRWWLTKAEDKILEGINNQRLRNEFAEAVSDYILKTPPAQRSTRWTVFEIATKILGIPAERINSQQGAIGRALKSLGFVKDRPMVNGIREWLHVVPQELLTAPHRPAGNLRHLNVVPSPKPTAPRPSAPAVSVPTGKPPKEG